MFRLNYSWGKWLLLNGLVILLFFVTIFLDEIEIMAFTHAFLGLSIFFLSGMNLAIILNRFLKDRLDIWELLAVGIIGSFFIIPALTFIIYKFFGSITIASIFSMHIFILASLIFLNYFPRNHVR